MKIGFLARLDRLAKLHLEKPLFVYYQEQETCSVAFIDILKALGVM